MPSAVPGRALSGIGSVAATLQALLALAAAPAPAQEIELVEVINFPAIQQVEGAVELAAPAPHAALFERRQLVVAPAPRSSPSDLVAAEPLQADGFTEAVLSLHVRTTDSRFRPGSVGAVLVPRREEVLRALSEDGVYLFALEVEAEVEPGPSPHFGSVPTKVLLGFPSYEVLLYNSTDKSVEVDLYIYATN